MDREILNIVNRVLSEELSDKLSNAKRRIFEGKKMCSECGSDMKEGMCSECGYNEGEVQEKLIGKQSKLDKNENGKLDSEDFRLLRKSKRKNIGEKDVEEGNAFTGALAKAREKGEENFKVGKKTFKVDESVYRVDIDGEKYLFNESEMIDVIENIVLEEKKKKKKTKSIDPIKLTKDNISKSGKENEDYINSVIKKMKDYLKDGSKGDYNMNPKDFPRGTNEKRNKIRKDNLLSKLKRKAYNKSAQPVINDKTGNETDKASKIMMNLESKEEKKVVNDIEKMKNLMEYYKKTQ